MCTPCMRVGGPRLALDARNLSFAYFAVLAVYSLLFMRFAWMVKPRNYFLLTCHMANEAAQLTQLGRKINYNMSDEGKLKAAAAKAEKAVLK